MGEKGTTIPNNPLTVTAAYILAYIFARAIIS